MNLRKLSELIGFLAWLAAAPALAADNARTSAQPINAATANATITADLFANESVVAFYVKGLTAAGATLTVEGSSDGRNDNDSAKVWYAINAITMACPATLFTTLTSDQGFKLESSGLTNVRLRVSSTGTGTILVSYNAIPGATTIGTCGLGVNSLQGLGPGVAALLAGPPTGTGVLVGSVNPIFTGLLTAGNTKSTASPGITETFANTAALTSFDFNVSDQSNTEEEFGGMFIFNANHGAANPVQAAKVALGVEILCNSGSASCEAYNPVATVNSGFVYSTSPAGGASTLEIDYNNVSGTNCITQDIGQPNNAGCGAVAITGASTDNVNFGLAITGGNNHTLNGLLFPTGGPVTNDILSFDTSTALIHDVGVHTYGLYLGGTYSSLIINTPTFAVFPSGFSFWGAGAFTANGAVATVLGAAGPTGSHTTVQEWFTIQDAGGTTRYIPAF
jgi:hypothetical protein